MNIHTVQVHHETYDLIDGFRLEIEVSSVLLHERKTIADPEVFNFSKIQFQYFSSTGGR